MARKTDYGHVYQDFRTLLTERDRQNAFLRSQLHTRIERNIQLESRLLATLDTLDEIQATAMLNLQRAERENARLARKLEVSRAVCRVAEKEKEDMSTVVLQLVSKVESCNDYSKWNAARIELSRSLSLRPQRSTKHPLDPPLRPALSSEPRLGDCACPHAYTPAIVTELAESLTREQRSHARTTAEAERRIAALQSCVAARDAEIARRVAVCQCFAIPTVTHNRLDILSDEEKIRVAALTVERNRVLGTEIIQLEEELEREKCSSVHLAAPQIERSVQTEPPNLDISPTTSNIHSHARKTNDNDGMPIALAVLDAQISQLRKGLADLAEEKDALHLILQDELGNIEKLATETRGRQSPVTFEPGYVERNEQKEYTDPHRNHEVKEEFQNILLIEEECIRLMRSEDELRSELNHVHNREVALSEENMRLKKKIMKMEDVPLANFEHNPTSQDVRSARENSNPVASSSNQWQPPISESRDVFSQPTAPGPFSRIPMSAIDIAFPPLEPLSMQSGSMSHSSPSLVPSEQVPQLMPSTLDHFSSTYSTPSSSSSSDLHTPTSPTDPSMIPLPETPPFDEAVDESDGGDVAMNPGDPPSITETDPSTIRDANAIARELSAARADAEAHEREIAEIQEAITLASLRLRDTQPHENINPDFTGHDGEHVDEDPSELE
ncbi:hypothetical protein EW145_g4730 [Phellinidium pouzarii]|uniref:Uncharacterized protein n=1 Tax=Phellinidium pouzarii TaxID=167371 RepID=A0A4S4L2N0_9AGAM|nr:hypothetical protein EW145_g4730 [Phellinidium pouzarii]